MTLPLGNPAEQALAEARARNAAMGGLARAQGARLAPGPLVIGAARGPSFMPRRRRPVQRIPVGPWRTVAPPPFAPPGPGE